jgi:hypothetical protein
MDKQRSMSVTNLKQAAEAASDIHVHGDPDAWECVCKTSSESQGWMRSTKRMKVVDPATRQLRGWLYSVSHMQRNENGTYALAEAVTFVPANR